MPPLFEFRLKPFVGTAVFFGKTLWKQKSGRIGRFF